MRGNYRGRVAADDAVCVDEGGPGALMYKAGAAGTGHYGRWLEALHRGSWRRSCVDKGADLDLWVHTSQKVEKRHSEASMTCRPQSPLSVQRVQVFLNLINSFSDYSNT